MTENQIRVLIFQDADLWCAQCLEHDIAVQADSSDQLLRELMDALAGYVEVGRAYGREPFTDLPAAPQQFFDMYERSEELEAHALAEIERDHAPSVVPSFRMLHPQLA